MSYPLNIVFPVYEGVTQLDFTGPVQFLVRIPQAQVIVASMGGKPIKAEGLTFSDLASLEEIGSADILCVPGGACHLAMEDEDFVAQVRRLGLAARYITSVCNGSLILGAAGMLVGKRAACHWSWADMLPLFGAVAEHARVVRDGNIITGGGVTAGIDFALTLIAEICGEEAAQAAQLNLEYAPAPAFNAGHPDVAPLHILAAVKAQRAPMMAASRARVEKVAARAGLASVVQTVTGQGAD